jgi:hypothetical protein
MVVDSELVFEKKHKKLAGLCVLDPVQYNPATMDI